MAASQNKTALARKLGVARSSLYYRPKKPKEDEVFKQKIFSLQDEHPAYGHRRVALFLGVNKKKALRVMKKFGIHPQIMRGKPTKPADRGKAPTGVQNLAKTICPVTPNALWAGDFTYLPWDDGFVYVATVIDVFTREIVGWHIGLRHTTALITEAFMDAAQRTGIVPQIFHSDQGSEYVSGPYALLLKRLGVLASQSKKSSPWENSYQESFYNNFKLELGRPGRFHDLGELVEAVHRQITYYNDRRIHLALKMPPQIFRQRYEQKIAALVAD
jgi:transposase InsO family protein